MAGCRITTRVSEPTPSGSGRIARRGPTTTIRVKTLGTTPISSPISARMRSMCGASVSARAG